MWEAIVAGTYPIDDTRRCIIMGGALIVLLLLALLFGGVGLFVEGLKWVLIIALVLFIVSAFTGYRGYAGRR